MQILKEAADDVVLNWTHLKDYYGSRRHLKHIFYVKIGWSEEYGPYEREYFAWTLKTPKRRQIWLTT